jgi:hypothetical protein
LLALCLSESHHVSLLHATRLHPGWAFDQITGDRPLVISLTGLDKLRKIGGIQGTKEKTTSELSSFGRYREAANRPFPIKISVAASSTRVKFRLAWSLEFFYGYR